MLGKTIFVSSNISNFNVVYFHDKTKLLNHFQPPLAKQSTRESEQSQQIYKCATLGNKPIEKSKSNSFTTKKIKFVKF